MNLSIQKPINRNDINPTPRSMKSAILTPTFRDVHSHFNHRHHYMDAAPHLHNISQQPSLCSFRSTSHFWGATSGCIIKSRTGERARTFCWRTRARVCLSTPVRRARVRLRVCSVCVCVCVHAPQRTQKPWAASGRAHSPASHSICTLLWAYHLRTPPPCGLFRHRSYLSSHAHTRTNRTISRQVYTLWAHTHACWCMLMLYRHISMLNIRY